MDLFSFVVGIAISVVTVPVGFLLIVSFRRMILDGAYIPDISTKSILVTGCDSGFGFALCERLDKIGCHVIATCLTKEGMNNLTAKLSTKATVLQMDVSKLQTVMDAEKVVRNTLTDSGLWAVVNNAGVSSHGGYFHFETLESMKNVMDVNVWGAVHVIKVFLPYLKKSKGRLINIGSLSGRVGIYGLVAYSISKHGIDALSDCLRIELALFGVSVHVIQPAFFRTSLTEWSSISDRCKATWENLPKETQEEYGKEFYEKAYVNREICDLLLYQENNFCCYTNIWLVLAIVFERDKRKWKKLLDIPMRFDNKVFVLGLGEEISKQSSTNIYQVIDAMEHALLSSNPKLRYTPGWYGHFLFWWFMLLPVDILVPVLSFILRPWLVLPAAVRKSKQTSST